MSETLRDTLEDIRSKLNSGVYQNEEHVRLSLVARVVQELGWNIWDPKEVNTEFAVAPDEDRTKVDMALFARDGFPAVLIEIKAVGKMEGNLGDIEIQVRDYNRDITAPFSIITDGRYWRFYYSKTGGIFSQKLFDELDLMESNTLKTAEMLENYLSKEEIRNGNAEDIAKKKLNASQLQEAMANAYPEAEQLTQREPFPSLPYALCAVMKRKGFDVSSDEAVAFIRSRAEIQPKILSPKTSKSKATPVTSTKKGGTSGILKIGNEEYPIDYRYEVLKYAVVYASKNGKLPEKIKLERGKTLVFSKKKLTGEEWNSDMIEIEDVGFYYNKSFSKQDSIRRVSKLIFRKSELTHKLDLLDFSLVE